MKALKQKLKVFFADERGATAVEYGLFVAAIAAVIVAVVVGLGTKVNSAFKSVNDAINVSSGG